MNKIFDFLIKRRYWIIGFFILLAIGNIFLMRFITINYDISSYLAKGSNTRVSLEIMNSEFESNGNFYIMVEDVTKAHANELKEIVEEVDGVKIVIFDSESEASYKDNDALLNVFLKTSNFDEATRETVRVIKEKLSSEKTAYIGGAIESLYLGDAVNGDMIMILLMALIIVFIILIINSASWIEPVIFMIVIGVAILINLGSNAFLPSISFVTGSICAVMQLALAMDYSIMLLHRYINEKELNPDISNYDAVKSALRKSVMPILSSGLTTVAGLISLVFMNFKIGFDIGLVLSKGIIISLIVVLFFMPGLLMVFSGLINKTKHRNVYQIIRQKFPTLEKKAAHYKYKSRYVMFGVLIVLIVIGFIFYLQTDYIYSLEASNDPKSQINLDKEKIEERFGSQNSMVILLPKDEEYHVDEVNNDLLNYDYKGENPFSSVQSSVTTGLSDYYTAPLLATQFGLPEEMITEVFKEIDESRDSFKLQEIITYLQTSSYISTYTGKMQEEFDNLYEISKLLDKTVNGEELSKLLTDYSGIEFSTNNAVALINKIGPSLTFKEFIIKIATDKFFNNLYNDYEKYVATANELEKEKTKEEVSAVFNINQDDLLSIYGTNNKMLLKDVVLSVDISKVPASEIDKFNYYLSVSNTKDIEYTKDEASAREEFSYNIIPSAAYIPAYLFKNKASNYDIQKSLATLLKSKISDTEDALDKASELVALVDKELAISEVSSSFDLPESFISPIYEDLNKDKVTGLELLTYIKDNSFIIHTGEAINGKIDEAAAQIDYAMASFESEHYYRIILNLKYRRSADEAVEISRLLQEDFKEYYSSYYVASECGAFADFEDTFAGDSIKISIASLCFILLIIAISFKSLAVPIILTLTIQGAIWFTMAISVWAKSEVYFICYLMIVCIQMGTTIDYGILYTSKYLEERKTSNQETSIAVASRNSITTILTSGAILVVASFLVGVLSKVSIISSIGYLLSIGTVVSLSFILLALPQVLLVSEHFIELTTVGWKRKK